MAAELLPVPVSNFAHTAAASRRSLYVVALHSKRVSNHLQTTKGTYDDSSHCTCGRNGCSVELGHRSLHARVRAAEAAQGTTRRYLADLSMGAGCAERPEAPPVRRQS